MSLNLYLRSLAPEGADITDESIACATEYVYGGTTYYLGYMEEMSNLSITDPLSSYGVYSAISGGGTKYTITESTIPAGDTILFDVSAGALVSASSRTVYANYKGFGTNGSFLMNAVNTKTVALNINQLCDAAGERTIGTLKIFGAADIVSCAISADNAVIGNVSVYIKTDAGESGTALLTTGNSYSVTNFSTVIPVLSSDRILINVGSNSAMLVNPTITLGYRL